MSSSEQHQRINRFIVNLSKKSMPAMSASVQHLRRLTADDASRVSQLTEQVLKDPSLTTRILQIVNSPMYRGAGQVNTITRAIVLMGFATVRDLSLSLKFLDDILKKPSTIHLKNVLAKSFHAAMQAQSMVVQTKHGSKEEVFISSLLYHLGEVSVLSRNDKTSLKLDELISNKGLTPGRAAQEVLGFPFKELTLGLATNWSLGQMLQDAVKMPADPNPTVQAILFGEELSQVAGLGWDSDPVKDVVGRIAKYSNRDFGVMLDHVKQVADYSCEMASLYGAEAVKHLIPPSNYTIETAKKLNVITYEEPSVEEKADSGVCQKMVELDITPDMIEAALEMRPLPSSEALLRQAMQKATKAEHDNSVDNREPCVVSVHPVSVVEDAPIQDITQALHIEYMLRIGHLLNGKSLNVNDIFSLIVEAMIEAVGMKRVVLGLLSKDRKNITAKLFGGDAQDAFNDDFSFGMIDDNAFSSCLHQAQPIWMGAKENQGKAYLLTPALQKTLKTESFFVAPVVVSRKPIGLFYADCVDAELTQQQFLNFILLAQQASTALSMMNS